MKIYSEEEILSMNTQEIKNIITVRTLEDELIFLDEIESITKTTISLKNGSVLKLSNDEKYNLMVEKLIQYKMFMRIQPVNTVDFKKISTIEENFEKNINEKIDKVVTKLDQSFIDIKKLFEDKYTSSLQIMETTTNKAAEETVEHMKQVKSKIDQINIDNLNANISKLDEILNILNAVV